MAVLLIRARRLPAALALAAGLLAAASAQAAGDAAHGRSIFAAQCSMCHSAARGGPTLLGPTLFGVVGRPAGSVGGYAYSSAMKAAGFSWSDEKLRSYLQAPTKMLPGVKMSYGGLKNPTQLDDLTAYLDTLK